MKQSEKNKLSQELILNSAIEAFSQNNINKVSLNEICRKNNISKGKMYHYFSSKEELYYACINYILKNLTVYVSSFQIKEGRNISDCFNEFFNSQIEYWINHPYDLLIISNVLDTFTDKEYAYIKSNYLEFRQIMKSKVFEIINAEKITEKVSFENIYQVIQIVIEKTFVPQIKKIVLALTNNQTDEANELRNNLLGIYDTLIYIILYGILS